jgi:alpha-tubulin suppressor-like RCC1 family protein
MAHSTRTPFSPTVSLLAILAALGCSHATDRNMGNAGGAGSVEELPGKIEFQIMQSPGANTCLVLSYTSSVTTGIASTYTMFASSTTPTSSVVIGNLPIGSITVTPKAYTMGTSPCTAAGVASRSATWIGASVTVTVDPGAPTRVPLTLHPYDVTASVDFSPAVTSIAVGTATSYALFADGTIRAWGYNGQGQLGKTPDTIANPTPWPVAMNGLTASSLASGSGALHMCAVNKGGSNNGFAYCWGRNDAGQLGQGNTTNLSTPTQVGTVAYSSITVGTSNTWAIVRTGGKLSGWGANANGQLGNGTTSPLLAPATPVDAVYEQLSGSYNHLLARNGPYVSGTGYNGHGELGTGDSVSYQQPTGTLFAGGSGNGNGLAALSVSAGKDHSCAVVGSNGAVQCVGTNQSGQLGDKTTTPRTTPVTVSGLNGAIAVSAGYDSTPNFNYGSTCAIRGNDSTIWCWGNNSNGQLGDGTLTSRLTPVQVVGITDAKMVALSDRYACALRADATVWCWGMNSWGQLGDGTVADRAVPTKVLIQ